MQLENHFRRQMDTVETTTVYLKVKVAQLLGIPWYLSILTSLIWSRNSWFICT